jgi:hypothetical protein
MADFNKVVATASAFIIAERVSNTLTVSMDALVLNSGRV